MAQNWFQHTLNRTGIQGGRQAPALVVLGVLLTLIFGGVYLSQIASYTAVSREISGLLEERDRLEFTNERLRADIAGLQTVPRLQARALELGFRDATAADIEYLVTEGYNPNRSRQILPESLDDTPEEVPTYDETFSGWLQQTFDSLGQQFQNFGQE